MMLAQYARQQIPKGQAHRVPCQFFEFTRDNLPNRILKATLRQVTQTIPEVRVPEARRALRAQADTIAPHFHAISPQTIRREDFAGLRLGGPLRHYRGILEKCRAMLGRTYLSTDLGPHVQSAFLWDMSLLFQEAVRGLLLRCAGATVDTSRGRAELRDGNDEVVSRSPVDPDYVVRIGPSTALLDAKYKQTGAADVAAAQSLNAEVADVRTLAIRRQDVYQLLAYGRHNRHPSDRLALVYPVTLLPRAAAPRSLPGDRIRRAGHGAVHRHRRVRYGQHSFLRRSGHRPARRPLARGPAAMVRVPGLSGTQFDRGGSA